MGIKLNGISVPIGGISWEYTESGQKGIQEMFYYLESKRLLINPKVQITLKRNASSATAERLFHF